MYIGALAKGQSVERDLASGRNAYVHVARGKLGLNGVAMEEGDGAKVTSEGRLKLDATTDTEVLLFDLP